MNTSDSNQPAMHDDANYDAQLEGDGAIAQGDGAIAAGARSVVVASGAISVNTVNNTGDNVTLNITQIEAGLPHLLRATPRPFVGREQELDDLVAQFNASGDTVIAIHGLPGVGKVAFANALAHRLEATYPDVQLVIALNTASNQATQATGLIQAMETCIFALYPSPQKIAWPMPAMRNAYILALQNKRALVVLNGAFDENSLDPFVPAEHSLMIVTSQQHLATGFAYTLKPLQIADSQELIQHIEPRIADEQAKSIAALCGGLPRALRLAASHLKTHPSTPVEDFVAELRESSADDVLEMAQLFAVAYRALTPDQQMALRQLALMPAEFDRAAALAVIGPMDKPKKALDQLVMTNLLDFDATHLRFAMNRLVQDYASAQQTARERTLSQERYIAYFAKQAALLDATYLQGGEKFLAGLKQFDELRTHIRRALNLALQMWDGDRTNIGRAQTLIDAVNAITYFGSLRFLPEDRVRWLQGQLEALQVAQSHTGEVFAYLGLGAANLELNDLSIASTHFNQCLDLAREQHNLQAECVALCSLGWIAVLHGDATQARLRADEALGISQTNDLLKRERCGALFLSATLRQVGENDKSGAQAECLQALKLAEETGDLLQEATIRSQLQAFSADGTRPQNTRRITDLAEQLNDPRIRQAALLSLGNSEIFQDPLAAQATYEKAVSVAQKSANAMGEANAWTLLAYAYLLQDNYADAQRCATEALKISRPMQQFYVTATAHYLLGMVASWTDVPDQAVQHLGEVCHSDVIKSLSFAAPAWYWLGANQLKLNDAANALVSIGQAVVMSQKYQDDTLLAWSLGLKVMILQRLAVNHMVANALDEALVQFETAITVAEEGQHPEFMASLEQGLGIAYFRKGDLLSARDHFQESLAALPTQPGDNTFTVTHLGLVRVALALGDLPLAIQHGEQALVLSQANNDMTNEAAAHDVLSSAYLQAGAGEQASAHAQAWLRCAEATANNDARVMAYERWIGALMKMAKWDEALVQLNRLQALAQSLGNVTTQIDVLWALAGLRGEQAQFPESLKSYEEALALAQQSGDAPRIAALTEQVTLARERIR